MKIKGTALIVSAAIAAAPLSPQAGFAAARRPDSTPLPEVYDITAGHAVEIPAHKTTLPLYIYGEAATATYIPSGYMGDASSIKLGSSDFSAPTASGQEGRTCLRVVYTGKGPAGWAGIWWLTPANNWGKIKGAGYDVTGSPTFKFWAKGEKGGERLSEVKIGGVVGPYPDTDTAGLGAIRLTNEWKEYTINLKGKDLRHIVGGFMFVVRRVDNPRGAAFYFDEMRFEAPPAPVTQAPAASTATVSGAAPLNTDDMKATIPFADTKTALNGNLDSVMSRLIQAAREHPESRFLVEGHSDNLGPEDVNVRLSLERARAVADYIQGEGIPASRIDIKGFGSGRPTTPDSNGTREGRLKNQRVEVSLVEPQP
ncbi:MAG: OmpA family protein [Elusimicrobia bacterium]|nr:OmpA family protein [Elusimicrobiota bacterium]